MTIVKYLHSILVHFQIQVLWLYYIKLHTNNSQGIIGGPSLPDACTNYPIFVQAEGSNICNISVENISLLCFCSWNFTSVQCQGSLLCTHPGSMQQMLNVLLDRMRRSRTLGRTSPRTASPPLFHAVQFISKWNIFHFKS